MKQYESKYVPLGTGGGFILNNRDTRHREVIDQLGAEGWRFVGYVPTLFTSYGGIKGIDLVFQREITEQED